MRKKRLLAITWSTVILLWIAMGTGLLLGVHGTARIVLLTVAAISLELGIWISAAILGISVFESRKRILAYIRGKSGDADER